MAFNINKVIGSKRGFFTHTGIGKVKPSRVKVSAEEVERWATEGKSRREMSREKGISYGYLNQIINGRESLRQAEQRGKRKCQKNKH